MTHYRVAVIQQKDDYTDLYDLLAPYDENLRVEPYVDRTRAEAIEYCRDVVQRAQERVSKGAGGEFDQEVIQHVNDEDETLHTWGTEFFEEECDEDGNWLTTYNPNSKYDYFSEIDEMSMEEWLATGTDESEEALRKEWKELSTNGDGFWKPEYYTESYGDENTFVKMCQLPTGWAVVTPDGTWHEPGRVGWFATDDATPETRKDWVNNFYDKFVEPYKNQDPRIIILDCHI